MRGTLLLDKMELVDGRFVEEAGGERAKTLRFKRTIVLIAAVLALAIIAVPTATLIANRTPGGDYSAAYVGGLFPGTYDSVGTNRYANVFVSDITALKYDGGNLPEGQTITVYKRDVSGKAIDREELERFADERLPGLCAALGYEIAMKGYETTERTIISYPTQATRDGEYVLSAHQNTLYNTIRLSGQMNKPNAALVFDGETVAVDARLSDEELSIALEPLRKKLCDVFGEDFGDMKIRKEYSIYSAALIKSMTISFYSKNEHPLNSCVDLRAGSCIELYFITDEDGDDPLESDGTLWRVSLSYDSLRVPAEKFFRAEKECDLISLEEAEELLKNGYVFGGHVCPLCMAEQQPVDFENYDAVRFKYVEGFPFYAFYKKLGTTMNGCEEYARTLVPAVRVNGWEEYFESQKSAHDTGWDVPAT